MKVPIELISNAVPLTAFCLEELENIVRYCAKMCEDQTSQSSSQTQIDTGFMLRDSVLHAFDLEDERPRHR